MPHPPCQQDDLSIASDEELVRAVRSGSSSAFALVVERHERGLLAFLRRRTGDRHTAEDLLQETFARAYRNAASYDARWKLSTWLYTIASRLAVSHFRKRRPGPLAEPERLRGRENDPSDRAERDEQRGKLWGLAERVLSANQYTALWLRYAEEMPVRQIAEVMGKTVTHVKVLLFRGRSALARHPELAGARAVGTDARSRSAAAAAAAAATGGGL